MEKQIKAITPLHFTQKSNGFKTVDMFHAEFQLEPFLVFTEFHMSRPIFGPHPHAGVSVMTYMLPDSEGSFLNRDSRGDKSTIEPGGIHVTQAGSGVKHDEIPERNGIDCHGFQIWINHADKDRLVEPKAFHAKSSEVPVYTKEGIHLRVIQGTYKNLTSPIELVTPTTLFDVKLAANTSIELHTQEMAFIYMLSGSVNIGKDFATATHIVTFETEGSLIRLTAGNNGANFMFASGKPHHEPIVYGGPFVMTTHEQLAQTQKRLQQGQMGVL